MREMKWWGHQPKRTLSIGLSLEEAGKQRDVPVARIHVGTIDWGSAGGHAGPIGAQGMRPRPAGCTLGPWRRGAAARRWRLS